MVNNVIGVVNYVIAARPPLLNFMIADTGEFRFVGGVSVGIIGRRRTCGDSVGHRGPPQEALLELSTLGEPGGQSEP